MDVDAQTRRAGDVNGARSGPFEVDALRGLEPDPARLAGRVEHVARLLEVAPFQTG